MDWGLFEKELVYHVGVVGHCALSANRCYGWPYTFAPYIPMALLRMRALSYACQYCGDMNTLSNNGFSTYTFLAALSLSLTACSDYGR